LESNLEEGSVGKVGGVSAVEAEVAELLFSAEGASDAGSRGGHGVTVAGKSVDIAESREIGSEAVGGVGDWDLVAVVVWGKGEVSDEVGGAVGGAVVGAGNGDGSSELVFIKRAGGVVKVTVGIDVLSPEDEDLNLGISINDSIEGGEFVGGGPEGSGDRDEPGVEVGTEGDGAGGVDWRVSGGSGDERTASVLDRLSWPVGVFGGNKGGKSGGDLHI